MRQTIIALAASLLVCGLALATPQGATAGKEDATAKKEEAPKKDAAPDQDPGRLVFDSSRCWMCHSIEGRGNKKTPLDGVGTKMTKDQIRKWLVSPKEMKAGTIMKSFSGLPKEDLDALVTYLSSQKKKDK